MQTIDLVLLYDYNYWATRRILDAAAKITPEQLLAPTTQSWGSLRDIFVHMLGAEWVWRVRCQEGAAPTRLLSPADFPSLDVLTARWQQEEAAMRAYVAGLTDSQVNEIQVYRTTKGVEHRAVRWQILAHVVNHGTQHRAEAAHVLTSCGASPGDIDLIVYLR